MRLANTTSGAARRAFAGAAAEAATHPLAKFTRALKDEQRNVEYTLLGTVHGTPTSVRHVEEVLDKVRPHELVLELERDDVEPLAALAQAPRGLGAFQSLALARGTVGRDAVERLLVEMAFARDAARARYPETRVVCADRPNLISLMRVYTFETSALRRGLLFGAALRGPPKKPFVPPFELAAEVATANADGVVLGRLVNQLVLMYERDLIFVAALRAAGERAAERARSAGSGPARVCGIFGLAHLPGIVASFDAPAPSQNLFDPSPPLIDRELLAARWLDLLRPRFAEGCRRCPMHVDFAENAVVTRCEKPTDDGRCGKLTVT